VKRSTVILSIALALASLVASAAAAQAANGVTVTKFPVPAFSLFNPCTNENLVLTGTALTVIDPTPDNHGVEFHSVDMALKGVGDKGTRFVETFSITISLQGTETTSDGGAFAETNAIVSRVIAPGPGNDLVFRIIFHFTINATGETVGLHVDRIEGECI
jgi:hypothetical protein